jgi:hypothetical protein
MQPHPREAIVRALMAGAGILLGLLALLAWSFWLADRP